MTEQLVIIRNSERTAWRRCRQKWHWSYRKQLEPKRHGGALTFGNMAHKAMELWYPPGKTRGIHPVETMRRLLADSGEDFSQWDAEGNKIPVDVLADTMMTGYVEHYGQDTGLEIIHPEEAFQIDVRDRKGRYLATVVGQFDALAIDLRTGKLVILEHKTAKVIEVVRINSQYGEQGLTYWWAATIWLRHLGILGPDQFIDGILYNFLRKGLPDPRPVDPMGRALNKPTKPALVDACRSEGLDVKGTMEVLAKRLRGAGVDVEALGEVSKVQPSALFRRQFVKLEPTQMQVFQGRLRREVRELKIAKAGRLEIYKNPTKDCGWDCGFRDVCEVHEMGGHIDDMLHYEFTKWDPYDAHRLELEKS